MTEEQAQLLAEIHAMLRTILFETASDRNEIQRQGKAIAAQETTIADLLARISKLESKPPEAA